MPDRLAQCPPTLFAGAATCPHVDPLPSPSRRHWPPEAHLLERLIDEGIPDWHAVDFPTLEALFDATQRYPTMEDLDDQLDDPDDPFSWAEIVTNPWHLVLGAGTLPIAPDHLPVVPIWTHPFY